MIDELNCANYYHIYKHMAKKIDNPPSAYVLMDSMRAIGYTFNSAIADIIDNSISADSHNINLFVSPVPTDIYFAILDDGDGMDETQLIMAMKYGSRPKTESRKDNDLGRFGLGLKSASLSQCRKLIVASSKSGKICAASWDLDEVEKTQSWSLLILDEDEINQLPHINDLKSSHDGTLVIWEDFDVLRQINEGREYKGLVDSVNDSFDYLSLIFHRYLGSGQNEVRIAINGNQLQPIDPFLESNKKTEVGKPNDITIPDSSGEERHITVTPYLLPFLKDLTESDKKKLGGVARINSMQGFYVYRNNRLIIFGTWFHMSYRNELAKYARIKVDIPSSLDEIWKIDIKKQNAELPPSIKRQLQRCVENAKFSSRRKNEHRLTLANGDQDSIWQKNLSRDNKAVYRINKNAPLIKNIIQCFEPSDANKIDILIHAIENSIPFHDMYTDEADDKIETEITEEDRAQIVADAVALVHIMRNIRPDSNEQLIEQLGSKQPYNQYEWFKDALRKELNNE
jgi:hypothetical protein